MFMFIIVFVVLILSWKAAKDIAGSYFASMVMSIFSFVFFTIMYFYGGDVEPENPFAVIYLELFQFVLPFAILTFIGSVYFSFGFYVKRG